MAAHYLRGKSAGDHGIERQDDDHNVCAAKFCRTGGLPVQVGGNIGVPVIALVDQSRDDGWSVLEVSSFQLETTYEFHPQIAVILNITPGPPRSPRDVRELCRGQGEDFRAADSEDALVLNADDDVASRAAAKARSQVFWFSQKRIVRQGAFVHEGVVTYRSSEQARRNRC